MAGIDRDRLAVWLALVLAGCATSPACRSSLACTGESVCGFRGACEALVSDPVGTSRWIWPARAALAPYARPLSDALPMGGPERVQVLLSFADLPPRISSALLVLSPHPRLARWPSAQWLAVDRVGTFEPGAQSVAPPELSPLLASARVLIQPGPARVVRLDLTAAAREAANVSAPLDLRLRVEGDGQIFFRSPLSTEPGQRPRLELTLQ